MAQTCINRSTTEFKNVAEALGSPIEANYLMTKWQKANNTDALPTVAQVIQYKKDQKTFNNLKTREFTDALYANLVRLGILTKFKGDHYIVSSRNRMFDPAIRKYNLDRLYNYLRVNHIPKDSIKRRNKGKGIVIDIERNVFTPSDIIPAARAFNTPHSREVVRHLMRLFPQLSVVMLSPADAKKAYDDLPDQQKSKVPFKDIRSFYVNGKAVLIEGRVTDDVAIEEILHPFVDSVYVDNIELFNKLLKEARKSFPELSQEINDAYRSNRGFSEKHRELELVTQGLSRHFNKEFTENETRPFKTAVKEFMEWFMDIIKNLSEYLTGKPFSARAISQNANLTGIAKLLNTSGIEFKIDRIADRKVRYNLTGGAKIAYNKVMESGNAVQKEIARQLFHAALHSPQDIGILAASAYNRKSPLLVLNQKTHTYKDINDIERAWKSTTERFSGKKSPEKQAEMDEKYAINLALGNNFDSITESLAAGLTKKEAFERVKEDAQEVEGGVILSEEQAGDAYDMMYEVLYNKESGLLRDGSVALPQVTVYDDATGTAGTIDLLVIRPDGTLKIIDLKTSKTSIRDYQGILGKKLDYDKAWEVEENSELVEKGLLKKDKNGKGKLSKRQKHNLQVNMYKRMLENMGYTISVEPDAVSTIHVKVGIKGKDKNQTFTGEFSYEEEQNHPPGQNGPYVDALIPLNIDTTSKEEINEAMALSPESVKSVSLKELLESDEQQPEGIEVAPEYSIITSALRSYQKGLIKKQEALNQLNKQTFLGRHQTTSQLQEQILNSIAAINIALGSGPSARSRIFSTLMRDAIRQIREFKNYVEDPQNFSKPEYISYVLNFDRFMETFKGLYKLQDSAELNATQKSLVLTLQTNANDLVGVGSFDNYTPGIIDDAIENYIRTIVKNTSSRNFTKEMLDDLMKFGNDIDVIELQTRDLATSKDTLLALMDKIYKSKKQELLDKIQDRERVIKAAASKLQKLSSINDPQDLYDFMLEFDKAGEFTGMYVQEIGPQYYARMKELRDALFDSTGQPKQFRDISDRTSASLEDIQYNIDLAKAKQKFANFFRAETIGLNDQPADGMYHKYTDEFKAERAKFQYFVAGGQHGYWKRKDGISDRAYERFMAKYFRVGLEEDARVIAKRGKNGEFTGETKTIYNPSPYPRAQYRVVRAEQSLRDDAGNITHDNLRSAKYEAIMKDDSALGQARKEFYLLFKKQFENDLLNKLPANQRSQMLGRVPVIRGKIFQDLKGKPNLVTKMFAKSTRGIKNLFTTTMQQRTVFADETGEIVDSIPIFYTGRTRSDEILSGIDEKIQQLNQERIDGKIKLDPYKKKMAELKGRRMEEESKPSRGELNKDMGNALLKFASMAEHYETMGSIEDTMKAMLKQIERRQYKTSAGKVKRVIKSKLGYEEKATIKGSDSNILRRAKKWMNMVYYDNDQLTKGFFEKVSDGLIQLSSLSYVAFNPFGNFNNYVLGRLNDNIEAIGGRYYSAQAYKRSSIEYNKRGIPDMIHRLASAASSVKGPRGGYDPEKANSKYEAFVELYRMMDSMAEIRESGSEIDRVGKSYFRRFMDWGYTLQDAAEWNVQTKVGIAMVIATMVKNEETGEILSLYDAHDFDAKTHDLKMKEGNWTIVKVDNKNLDDDGNPLVLREMGKYDDQYRYQLRNQIREVNKQIHGNYAYEDRMVMQSSTVGKLAAQFHKWIAPAMRARFDKEYYDENLGWVEGRYRSWWSFMGYVRRQLAKGDLKFNQYAEGFLEDNGYLKDAGWQDNQKALNRLQGFYRSMGEMGIILLTVLIKELMQSLWSDDGDESDFEKRLENILMYQADRTLTELILFIPLIGSQEQMQIVKSPVASTRTMGELGEAIFSLIETPYYAITQSGDDFYANSNVVYQRGRRKGQLKLTKEWQDAVPILYTVKKWTNYLDMKNFFIK